MGLDIALFPYKTISNRTGVNKSIGGIIEVIKNTQSRDEIGKTYGIPLDEYYRNHFGSVDQRSFQQAQHNFISSQAGYSIVSYIL